MEIIIWFIVIIAFIYLSMLVKAFKIIWLNPVRIPKIQRSSIAQIPSKLKPIFAKGNQQLKALGFEGVCVHEAENVYQHIDLKSNYIYYWHPKYRCYATLSLSDFPSAKKPFEVNFSAYNESNEYLGTYKSAYGIFNEYPHYHIKDYNHESLTERFKAYVKDLQEQVHTEHNKHHTPADLATLSTQSITKYYDYLLQKKYYKKQGNGYKFTLKGAYKIFKQVISTPAKDRAAEKSEAKEFIHNQEHLAAAEVIAYQKTHALTHHPQFNNWIKTLIFIASGIAFALLFGSAFSYTMLLALIPVLLFHELGHYLMMKLFKYEDLQILFLPLGAAVTAKENNTSVIKKVMVYLAGPVPGLIIAYFIYANLNLFADTVWATYMFDLALMAFIINYFNLLPIKPLDGGQIFELALFSRMPKLQLVFQIISVLAFFALAVLLDGTLIYVLAFFLLFTLIGEFKNTQIKSAFKNQSFENETTLLRHLFWHLRSEAIPFEEKRELIEQVKPQLEQPKAQWHEVVIGLTMYLSLLFTPLVLFYQSYNPFSFNEQYTAEYWQEQVEKQTTLAEKVEVYDEALGVLFAEDYGFFDTDELVQEAIILLESNNLKQHDLYPKLLKLRLLNKFYDDPENINQYDIDEIINELGENHVVIADIYLAINGYQFSEHSFQQIQDVIQIAQLGDNDYLVTQAHSLQISYHLHNKQYQQAIDVTEILIQIEPELIHHHRLNLGWIHMLNNEVDKARQIFTQILNINHDQSYYNSNAYEAVGWTYLAVKDINNATKYFHQADQVTAQEFKGYGMDLDDETTPPHMLDKWLVLYWLSKDKTSLDKTYAQWQHLNRDYVDEMEDLYEMTVDNHLASPQQIYTYPMVMDALTSLP